MSGKERTCNLIGMQIAHSTNWIYVYNHNLTSGRLRQERIRLPDFFLTFVRNLNIGNFISPDGHRDPAG